MFSTIIAAAIVGAIMVADNTVLNGEISKTIDKSAEVVGDIMRAPKEVSDFYNDRLH